MIQNWVNDIYSHPPTKKNEAKPLKPKSVKNISDEDLNSISGGTEYQNDIILEIGSIISKKR